MGIRISLKRLWTLLVIFSATVPVIFVLVWYGFELHETSLKQTLETESRVNDLLGLKIESEINRFVTLVENKTYSLDTLLDETDTTKAMLEINRLLTLTIEREPVILELSIVLEHGGSLVMIDPLMQISSEKQLSDKERALVMMKRGVMKSLAPPELVIPLGGNVYIGTSRTHHDVPVLIISVPIGHPVKAVFMAVIRLDQIWSKEIYRASFSTLNESYSYILDDRGILLTPLGGSQYQPGDIMSSFPIVRASLNETPWQSNNVHLGPMNVPVYGNTTAIPLLGWSLILEVPASKIKNPVYLAITYIAVITLILLVFFIWLVLLMAKRTLLPIQQTIEYCQHISVDNFKTIPKDSGIVELDMLNHSFKTMLDIRESIQLQVKNNEAKFRGIIESSMDGVLLCDEHGIISLVNPSIVHLSGYLADELIGQNIGMIVPARFTQHKHHRKGYMSNLSTRPMGLTSDLFLLRKDGNEVPIEISLNPVNTHEGKIIAAMVKDITARKKAEDKILQQAHYDSLTGLANRFLSLDRLSALLLTAERNKTQVAVLFLDLDDFKKVNDTLGHDAGDKLLVETATRFSGAVRKSDTVGRLGGDEFIILLNDIGNVKNIHRLIETLLSRVRAPYLINDRELMMTSSLGISIYPDDGLEVSELLRNADTAMYHAKNQGRNTYSYYQANMKHLVERRLSIEEQMRYGLERGEFSVNYQPKINLTTGIIMGAEALLRWKNPVLGQIFPDEFIPIAERNGLIIPLGEYVLAEAMRATEKWLKTCRTEFNIAINISPRQFREFGLVSFISKTMESFNLSAEHLELEITEGVLVGANDNIDKALSDLSELGVGIAMDDFGTGYSSLSHLRKYPFTVLKIDRSFINDILTDINDKKLTNATIAMSHALNLRVVAEGIETQDQLAALKKMKCDYGQGYLFGKPMTEEALTQLLQAKVLP
jgi:diguanylate cyclase (GGDEF)-like protein/PAS domain S-box-containing protein